MVVETGRLVDRSTNGRFDRAARRRQQAGLSEIEEESMHSYLRVAALVAAAALVLSSCGTAAPPSAPASATASLAATATPAPEPIVLNIMHNWGPAQPARYEAMQAAFAGFQKDHPNVTIKEEIFGDDEIPTKVETAYVAGQEPDLVFQNLFQQTRDWLESGVVVDVAPVLEATGLNDQLGSVPLGEYTLDDGRVGAIPLEGFMISIWYNQKILAAAGVDAPKTFQDLLDAVPKIKSAGYEPMVLGSDSGWSFFHVLLQSGAADVDVPDLYKNGGWSKSPGVLEALKAFVKLRNTGFVLGSGSALTQEAMHQVFGDSKAAMAWEGSWGYSEIPANIQSDVKLIGIPLASGSPRTAPMVLSHFTGKGIFVTRNGAKKLSTVEDFIKYFYRPEVLSPLVVNGGVITPLKAPPTFPAGTSPVLGESFALVSQLDAKSVDNARAVGLQVPQAIFADWQNVIKSAYSSNASAEEIAQQLDSLYP